MKRLTTAALCVLTIPDFFGYAPREWFIAVSLLILLVWREITVPRIAVRPLALLASASMWIYITHFTIWPPLVDLLGIEGAYIPTLVGGIAISLVAERLPELGRSVASHRSVDLAIAPRLSMPEGSDRRRLRVRPNGGPTSEGCASDGQSCPGDRGHCTSV